MEAVFLSSGEPVFCNNRPQPGILVQREILSMLQWIIKSWSIYKLRCLPFFQQNLSLAAFSFQNLGSQALPLSVSERPQDCWLSDTSHPQVVLHIWVCNEKSRQFRSATTRLQLWTLCFHKGSTILRTEFYFYFIGVFVWFFFFKQP